MKRAEKLKNDPPELIAGLTHKSGSPATYRRSAQIRASEGTVMLNTRGGEDRTPRAARPEDRPTQFHHIEKRLKKSRLIVAGTTLLTAGPSVFTRREYVLR